MTCNVTPSQLNAAIAAMTPAQLAAYVASLPSATDAQRGLVSLSVAANYSQATNDTEAVTPAHLAAALAALPGAVSVPTATDTVAGISALAVAANYPSVSNTEATTPAYVAAALAALPAATGVTPAALAAVTPGTSGASLVGVADSAGNLAAANVEGALAELAQKLYDPNMTRLFPTGQAVDAARIQAAIVAMDAAGGGRLSLAAGDWPIAGVVTATLTRGVEVALDPGCRVRQMVAASVFNITLTGGLARFVVTGNGMLSAGFSGHCPTAAIVCTGDTSPRGLCISGDVWVRGSSGSTWSYGLHTNNVQDMDLNGLLVSGDGEAGGLMSGVQVQSNASASVSHTVRGVDVYDCLYGVRVVSTNNPGVEGLKFIDVDLAGCKFGVDYDNTTGYAPPQVELFACHINSYNTCVTVRNAIQVSVIGGLFYRYSRAGGPFTEGAFFEFGGVQDLSMSNVHMSVITSALAIPAVVASSTAAATAFLRFDGCHYWSSAAAPFLRLVGTVFQVAVGSTNTKSGTGAWVDYAGVTSGLPSVRLEEGVILAPADYQNTVLTDVALVGGVLDCAAAFWQRVNITGAVGTVTSLVNTRPGSYYYLKCDTSGMVLQHNATCNLRGAINYVFSAGDVITLYQEVGTLREVSRRAA